MATSSDITALITRQTNAVASIEDSASKMAAFVNNDADTPVVIGGNNVPSIQGVVAEALAVAGRRNWEINWSQDDLSAYPSGQRALFRIYPSNPVTFPVDLAGSSFRLAQAPTSTLRLQFSMGGSLLSVTFAVGSTTGVFSNFQVPVTVQSGQSISATISTALNNASGLSITLLGQVNPSS